MAAHPDNTGTTETYAGERVSDSSGAAAVGKAKTSAAATFALVFGLSALFTALLALLAPLAVVFGLIGLVLGVVGLRMAKKVGVTGRGLAIGGLVLSVLGLLLGLLLTAGAAFFVTETGLNDLQQRIENIRADLNLPDVDVQAPDIDVQSS